MRLVVLESPFSGAEVLNLAYARSCVRDCIDRGEAPIASHLLYTQHGILRDWITEERTLGIAVGHAWYRVAEACVVYTDRGISRGMRAGMAAAEAAGVPIEIRTLPAIA